MNRLINILIFASILPAIIIGKVGFPWYVILSPLVFLFILVKVRSISKNALFLFVIWILMITDIFLIGLVQPYIKLNEIVFSLDFLNYTIKYLYFIFFFWVGYNGIVSPKKFLRVFLVFLSFGLLIGILQWLKWFGSDFLSSLYTFNENQFHLATRTDQFILRRIPGFANFATAQGGISAFIILLGIGYYKIYKDKKLLFFVILLGFANLIASGGRAGQLMFLFGVFLFIFLKLSVRINKKIFFKILFIVIAFTLIVYVLYQFDVSLVRRNVDRFGLAFKEINEGGGRVRNIKNAFSLMQNTFDYLFGVSRVVQSNAKSIYIEVEFFNILILYGILGFILHYGLIFILGYYFYKHSKKGIIEKRNLATIAFILLVSYQIFSLGYYFFREMYVGQIPWIVFAYVFGYLEKSVIINET